jgi:hypothetical protein
MPVDSKVRSETREEGGLRMGGLLRFLSTVVVAALSVASPALALQEAQETPEGAAVTATGVLERPEITTYQYGEYAVTDEATGTLYALGSDSVDLGALVGERVTVTGTPVTGTPVPGYEDGQVEGGPPLLDVTAVESAGGEPGGTTGGTGKDGTVTATFRLVVEGELPEDFSFYVEDSTGTGGVICTTDGDAIETAGYPECRDGGAANETEIPVPAGRSFDYRILASRGVELSQQVVDEGSLSPTGDFTVNATYDAAEAGDQYAPETGEDQYDGSDPDSSAPEEPDLNGDGVVDEADGEHAARVSERGDRATDDEEDPVLPDTGGHLPPLLLVAGGLLGGLLVARLHARRRS